MTFVITVSQTWELDGYTAVTESIVGPFDSRDAAAPEVDRLNEQLEEAVQAALDVMPPGSYRSSISVDEVLPAGELTIYTRVAPVSCAVCGMRADADPEFHAERYGHWPVSRNG